MKIHKEWKLKDIYKNINDEGIEKDVKKIESLHRSFERKYRDNRSYLSKVQDLIVALSDYEKLYETPKPLSYLFLNKALDLGNTDIDARISLIQKRLVAALNRVSFFKESFRDISKENKEAFLKNTKLEPFKYFFERMLEEASHALSEKETQLLNEIASPVSDLWVNLTERLQSEKVILFKDMEIPLFAANSFLVTLNKKDREALWKEVTLRYKEDSLVAESELNALYSIKETLDKKRGFKQPFDETLVDFETTKKELKALRDSVSQNMDISHDFYVLKKKHLKLKKLSYADRNVDIGTLKKTFSFEESIDILRRVFFLYNPVFTEILDTMLSDGRIDVFPRKGKMSGAFCSGTVNFPTFVMLNHVNTVDSLSTFAHEMGHAIHTELSKSVRSVYQGYSTAVAEFSSTFFEELLFTEINKELTKKEQKILLHNRINRDISTIFRQMAFFEFESDLHTALREKGFVSREEIASLLNARMSEYLGDSVALTPDDGYFFVTLSHIRRHFYVYSYAYGGLLSRLLAKRVLENPDLLEGVTRLLSRGSEVSPRDLFRAVGVNTESKKTFDTAFSIIREDLARLKNM